ncbi:MAG: mechanosensitive ion channel family protein [Epsilonproteobacteria bacterium]|nr:MAG: mechanosensitive ion channel family protein [Campylobacterota bacterium]
MSKILYIAIFLSSVLFAEVVLVENNLTIQQKQQQLIEEKAKALKELQELENKEIEKKEQKRKAKISSYALELQRIENEILLEKVWMKSYASYLTSLDIREQLLKITSRIKKLKKKKKNIQTMDELNTLISKEKILSSQMEKLKEKNSAPFSRLLTPPVVEEAPEMTNPIDIFSGISLIKKQSADLQDYITRKEKLIVLIDLLRQERDIYEKIKIIDTKNRYTKDAKIKSKQLQRFETALDTSMVTTEIYQNRLEIIEININKEIEQQMYKLANIGIIVLVVFIIFFLMKLAVKKYITDNERFYMANKIITFTNVTLVIVILFFNYIENVSYLVTILGFASAGIAIAMKDWFMSILGWLVIVFGGSIHVGDRIRVDMDGMKYVGDVMDISLLRMTILEDITLTSITKNRRAGRIIFVPNNYIFTRMIANYTHSSLKTVWDGIEITITYDSNHKKAMHICKEITKKYSKGYTDITRKQLNKLRSHYSLKNTNVEPRIFSFIESNGVKIDAWYLTNAYATLTLRSVISIEIVNAFNNEDDITIAYPTQMLHMEKSAKTPPFALEEAEVIV